MNGVHVNEVQGNPFQPDINYRGYTASPLLGTPQGLSVYMDGVRLNQPFGEVVSWDLIPGIAIASTHADAGLESAVRPEHARRRALDPDQGRPVNAGHDRARRSTAATRAGPFEFEHGGRTHGGLHWYLAGNLFAEDGWRDDSPSDVRQFFGKLGWQRATHDVDAHASSHADNSLTGNGLQEAGLSRRATMPASTPSPTSPTTASTFLNVTGAPHLREPRDVVRQRLLPRHPHEHAQRRHQRGLARPGALSAQRRRARGARRGRLHRLPDQRRQCQQHAVSRPGAASATCC